MCFLALLAHVRLQDNHTVEDGIKWRSELVVEARKHGLIVSTFGAFTFKIFLRTDVREDKHSLPLATKFVLLDARVVENTVNGLGLALVMVS